MFSPIKEIEFSQDSHRENYLFKVFLPNANFSISSNPYILMTNLKREVGLFKIRGII
jgi:hypothetical protein